MKFVSTILLILVTNFIFSQNNIEDNRQQGLRHELIDSTLTLIHNIIIKSKVPEINKCMDKIIVINSANQLLNNPYSKINNILDRPYSENNQFEKKNIKKLIKELEINGEIEFWKITISAVNDNYCIIVNPLKVIINKKNKVYVKNFAGLAMSCFKSNFNIKYEWELVNFEISKAYKL